MITIHGWPSTCQQTVMRRRLWLGILVTLAPVVLLAGVKPASLRPPTESLEDRERQVSRDVTRAAEFNSVRHISSLPSCENVQPPEPLTTPDPLFGHSLRPQKVKVSFIVGIDGRVRSPLILQSAGMAGDQRVLQTIRTWRYRPATCNGVPAETEGNIEFSSR